MKCICGSAVHYQIGDNDDIVYSPNKYRETEGIKGKLRVLLQPPCLVAGII